MEGGRSSNRNSTWIVAFAVVLVLCVTASLTVLFGRMASYSSVTFENVMPLLEAEHSAGLAYAPHVSYPAAPPSADGAATPSVPDTNENEGTTTPATGTDVPATEAGAQSGVEGTLPGDETVAHPEFRMVAEAEIFKFTYDETGKLTVISNNGGADKLIAPGTSNTYQFTLENPGNVPLDYNLTMEAYVTGTDLYLPVNVRVWDYKNKYLVGSPNEMVDVMELNTVDESAGLSAGRYAAYTLEWEWPFEWGDDEHDTLLGNLAVDDDIVLTIVIRTVAEYDDDPDGPSMGIPPKTGDESKVTYLALICAASVAGICFIMLTGRRERALDEGKGGKVQG